MKRATLIRDHHQQTIRQETTYSGITLHTGVRARVTLKPAKENTGITFRRIDLPEKPQVKASANQVINVERATTIAQGKASIHTVEHLLAALYACQIDNVLVEMDGPEPPIADGSSSAYLQCLQQAGVCRQQEKQTFIVIQEPIVVRQGDSTLIALPHDDYKISCTVQYGKSMMDTQYLSLIVDQLSFTQGIAQARTFCLYEEIEQLMLKNLIRGGSLDNAVVLKDGAILCKEGLRFPDEFVRHKILDMIGDFSLSGYRVCGEVIAIKPGHPINVALARTLMHEVESMIENSI